ncbi:hypothetical protein BH10PSE11_BH10PSE11_02390 [soil metagenome]
MSIQDVDRPATNPRPAYAGNQSGDIAYLSAVELVELYRQRKLSPLDVTRSILDRINRLDPLAYYYLVLGVVAIVLIALWNLANSRLGLKLRATHADETAASARGINVVFLKASVFVASAAISAFSGSLYVHNVQFVAPDTFGLNYSLVLVIMLVVGGMGRIWGGILGVVLLGWMSELLREAATWQPVIFGSILAIIMLFAPNGLAGALRRGSFFAPVPRQAGMRRFTLRASAF